MGFFCHHQYAHSHEKSRKSIPGAFEGVDLAVYTAFKAFGLKVGMHPIVSNQKQPDYGDLSEDLMNMGGMSSKSLMAIGLCDSVGDPVELFLDNLKREACERENPDSEEEESAWMYDDRDLDSRTIVGNKLHGPTFDNGYEEESSEVGSLTLNGNSGYC